MSLDYGFSTLTTILYIKAKFQFTGCNDFHLCEHSSKLLVLLLSSQTKTDNYKSLGDTAVLILHFLFQNSRAHHLNEFYTIVFMLLTGVLLSGLMCPMLHEHIT